MLNITSTLMHDSDDVQDLHILTLTNYDRYLLT